MKKSKTKKNSFFQEFANFINRGNVFDLAVGIIIGSSFSKIVNSLISDIIMPIISILSGGGNLASLSITIPSAIPDKPSTIVPYGLFLQNVIDFLIVAFSIFLIIKFLNKIQKLATNTTEELVSTVIEKKAGVESALKREITKTFKS